MRAWHVLFIAGLMTSGLGQPVAAQDSGLSGLHDKVRVRGKLCMADHYHSGASSGLSSRTAAEVAAIRSGQDFTAWEYGGAWASFAMAEGKSLSCWGGGGWGCSVEARACRR